MTHNAAEWQSYKLVWLFIYLLENLFDVCISAPYAGIAVVCV